MSLVLPPGRRIERINGRFLVWTSSMLVDFISNSGTITIPLFNKREDAGRFLAEADGFLSFPDTAEVRLFDSGQAYEILYFAERYTVAPLANAST